MNKAVIVSGGLERDSAIHMHVSFLHFVFLIGLTEAFRAESIMI